MTQKQQLQTKPEAKDRETRVAAALRENLQKRKQQKLAQAKAGKTNE